MSLLGIFGKKAKNADKPKPVIVVSGLPRSGTSMMMKMLDAGGVEPLVDNIRTADEDNPKGYYEFERVKGLDKGDTEWVVDAQGKTVKVISALLKYLPPEYQYKVIFMKRRLEENLQSQKKMLVRRGEDPNQISDDELRALLQQHLTLVDTWLRKQPNIDLLYVPYHEMVENPASNVDTLCTFLDGDLNRDGMMGTVDQSLYRNRASSEDSAGSS